MNHNEDAPNDAPLAQFQDVSRKSDACVVSLHRSLSHQSQTYTLNKSETSSSSSTISTRSVQDNPSKVICTDAVNRVSSHLESSERPGVNRAISYGAAAPYAVIDLNTFRSNGIPSPVATRPTSIFSEKTIDQGESQLQAVSRVSTDAQGFTYPEGGLQAWLCVLGSFCGMMSALGIMNTIGTIHTYISEHQLQGTSESTIGWIFSIYTFLSFFCGIQIGPLFDAYGPRYLIAPGSVLILLTWFLLGLCTQYWQFIVVFSICGGLGTSLVFTPSVTAVGHFFLRKRGVCTGLAAAGGSMGGVVYPLVLQALFPKVGFAWATRVIGFISIVLVIIANLCIRSRLPPRKATKEAILPDLMIFRDPILTLTTVGIFFIEWALFIPLTYLTSYGLSSGLDANLSYQIIAFMNVGSCFGRWLPGLIADRWGRFNTMIVTIALCMITTLAIWLPAGSSAAAIITYAVIFGFASGTGISLTPVCVSQLCKVENYGRYYATCYTIVSFACLTGVPIAGSLLTTTGGAYWSVIIFTGCAYSGAFASFTAARVVGVGWGFRKVY